MTTVPHRTPTPHPFIGPALIATLTEDPARVLVRRLDRNPPGPIEARLALATPYHPTEGDRVLVAGDSDLYVIGVLCVAIPATPPSIPLTGGGAVSVAGDTVEVSDHTGRILIRWEAGSAEIAAPTGDLSLSAPSGRVLVRSGADIEIDATGDLVQRAGHRATVEAPRLEVRADEAHVTAGQATLLAERIVTKAAAILQEVERFELTATRLFERAKDAYRETSGLSQTRAGRLRTIVEDAFSLHARRTAITSKEETSIDGSKVLLG